MWDSKKYFKIEFTFYIDTDGYLHSPSLWRIFNLEKRNWITAHTYQSGNSWLKSRNQVCISKWSEFLPSLVMNFSLISSNFVSSGIKRSKVYSVIIFNVALFLILFIYISIGCLSVRFFFFDDILKIILNIFRYVSLPLKII